MPLADRFGLLRQDITTEIVGGHHHEYTECAEQGKRRRERPMEMWMSNIREDMKALQRAWLNIEVCCTL